MKITFTAGPGVHFEDSVNFMISEDRTLYAETPYPEGVEEDCGYMSLKKAILKLAADNDIPADSLEFWYDGQEQYLSDDARADVEIFADYRG